MKAQPLISAGILVLVLCFSWYWKHSTAGTNDISASPSTTTPFVSSQDASEAESGKKAADTEIANATAVTASAQVKTLRVPDIKDYSQGFEADLLRVNKLHLKVKQMDDGSIHTYRLCADEDISSLTSQTKV